MTAAVVFDLYGTLTGEEGARDDHVGPLAAELGVERERLVEGLRETYDTRARDTMGDIRVQMLELAKLAGGDPTPEALDRALERRMEAQVALLVPRRGALDVLTELRARQVRVGVCSDCTPETPVVWSQSPFAPFVDFPLFSCGIGTRKPDARMYETVLAALGVAPTDAVYIGDGGSHELSGARRVGLRPVLLDVPSERHFFRYDHEVDWDGERVEDITELIGLL